MNTMKAVFRSLLVMLFLWMISLLVYYWPLPEEVAKLMPVTQTMERGIGMENALDQRVRVLQVD
jgi:hypothetical protein